MSTKEYYRQYNASPIGKARMGRFLASPGRKIYRAAYDAAHPEQGKAYDAKYAAKRLARARAHPRPRVMRLCATLLCTAMVWRAHGRKFCEPCRRAFGYDAQSRWWRRQRDLRA